MKRKTIITISGEDGDDRVTVKMKFAPSLEMKEENDPPPSGWNNATGLALDFVKSLSKPSEE